MTKILFIALLSACISNGFQFQIPLTASFSAKVGKPFSCAYCLPFWVALLFIIGAFAINPQSFPNLWAFAAAPIAAVFGTIIRKIQTF